MKVNLSQDGRVLAVDFAQPQRTLSWAVLGGGFGVHTAVAWLFVTRADLPKEVDPRALLQNELEARGYGGGDVIGLLTARRLAPYADMAATSGKTRARALVTVGLGNALRAGDPTLRELPGQASAMSRTINVLCHIGTRLTDAGLVEAMALASEARTAAILDLGYPSAVSGRPATGTGTDCIVVACPDEGAAEPYAGKHTDVGAALGGAVYEATRRAAEEWLREQAR